MGAAGLLVLAVCGDWARPGDSPVVVIALTAWVGRGAGHIIRAPGAFGDVQMQTLLTLLPPALGAGIVAVPRPVAVPPAPETSPRRPCKLAQGRSLWLGRRVLWLGIPLLHLGLRHRRLLLLLRLALAVQDAPDRLHQGPSRRLRIVGGAVLLEENVTLPRERHAARPIAQHWATAAAVHQGTGQGPWASTILEYDQQVGECPPAPASWRADAAPAGASAIAGATFGATAGRGFHAAAATSCT